MSSYDNVLNENTYNTKKSRRSSTFLKKIFKSICEVLKKSHSNTYKGASQPDYFVDTDSEISDNLANESLENEIFEEMDECDEFAAVTVYDGQCNSRLQPICRGQRSIPVHFARTESGTFFWTSTSGADRDLDYHGDKNAITHHQRPVLQVPVLA